MLSLLLKDIAQAKDLSLGVDATLRQIVDVIDTNRKGVVVLLRERCPVGILTERDVVELLSRGGTLDDPVDPRFSTRTLVTAKGDRTIAFALSITLDNNVRRLIVTDNANHFLGVVTQLDLLKYLEEDSYRSTMRVKHIISNLKPLVSTSPREKLTSVLQQMVDHKIGAVVITRNDKAVGIITEKDILKLARCNVPLTDTVERHMTRALVCADTNTPLEHIVELMKERNIRRVVIVNNEEAATNVVTVRDVVENLDGSYSKFLERKLRNAKDVLNLLPDMLLEVEDTEGGAIIRWANASIIERFGKEILDKPVTEVVPEEGWEQVYEAINNVRKVEKVRARKDERTYEISGFFTGDSAPEAGRSQLILLRDITEDMKLSTLDPLTNVFNRRFINQILIKEIARSQRYGKEFSLVICDLDGFKHINDTYGHVIGDRVLTFFSQFVANDLRKVDIVGRYGGDEFVLVLPETTRAKAEGVVTRLQEKLQNEVLLLPNGQSIRVASSFGIATYPMNGPSSDDLLVAADQELYIDKSKRRASNFGDSVSNKYESTGSVPTANPN